MVSINTFYKTPTSFLNSNSDLMTLAIKSEQKKPKNPLEKTEENLESAVTRKVINQVSNSDYFSDYQDKTANMRVYHLNDFGHQYVIYDKNSDQYHFSYKIDVYSNGKIHIKMPTLSADINGTLDFSHGLSDVRVNQNGILKPLLSFFFLPPY